MAWAALLIGLCTGGAIFVATIATISQRRETLRSRFRRVRRTDRAASIDPNRLRTFHDLRDELLLQAQLANHLSTTAGDNDFDATLDEFRRASEAFLELAAETRRTA